MRLFYSREHVQGAWQHKKRRRRLSGGTRIEVLGPGPVRANQTFHRSRVNQQKVKTVTFFRLTATIHSIGQNALKKHSRYLSDVERETHFKRRLISFNLNSVPVLKRRTLNQQFEDCPHQYFSGKIACDAIICAVHHDDHGSPKIEPSDSIVKRDLELWKRRVHAQCAWMCP